MMRPLFLVLFLVMLSPVYAQQIPDPGKAGSMDNLKIQPVPTWRDSIIDMAKTYLGAPYRSRGTTRKGFDCSGYVSMLYRHFGVTLPHSSGGIAAVGKPIPKEEIKKGDLVFFKGRNAAQKRVGHVSMVVDASGGRILMIHATNHSGVILEYVDESQYFKKRYLFARRVKD